MDRSQVNLDFWSFNPTQDECIQVFGEIFPKQGESLAPHNTQQIKEDTNAAAIAVLLAIRGDKKGAKEYIAYIKKTQDKDALTLNLKTIRKLID